MKWNPIRIIRESKAAKYIVAFLVINLITQLGFPSVSFALTSGPGQQEFASFEPSSTSDMVDMYSGDFNYNIPLLTIPGPNGGYPINLAYHSGIGMEEEASWVGLGWSLNVGAINRQIRGIPDDYGYNSGQGSANNVVHTLHLKEASSFHMSLPIPPNGIGQNELFGAYTNGKNIGNYEIYYNNYKGLGFRIYAYFGYPDPTSDAESSVGVGISYDSQNGLGIEPDLSLRGKQSGVKGALSLHASYNSRAGLEGVNFSGSASNSHEDLENVSQNSDGSANVNEMRLPGVGVGSSISFGVTQYPQELTIPMKSNTYQLQLFIGPNPAWANFYSSLVGTWQASLTTSENDPNYYNTQNNTQNSDNTQDAVINDTAYGYLYTNNIGSLGSGLKDFSRDDIPYSDNVPNLPPSSFTYDIYQQTGQGTGNVFRPYLSNIGVLADPYRQSQNNSYSLAVEAGVGVTVHARLGYTQTNGTSLSGPWIEGYGDDINSTLGNFNYNSSNAVADPSYEPYYFQVYGEKTATILSDDYLANNWGGDQAVRTQIGESNPFPWLDRHFYTKGPFIRPSSSYSTVPSPSNYKLTSGRQTRGTNIETFTNVQAQTYGYSAQLSYDDQSNQTSLPSPYVEPTANLHAKDFHTSSSNPNYIVPGGISEMSVLQPDGMRYVYGLPQYNNYQLNATFSVNQNNTANQIPTIAAADRSKAQVPQNNSHTAIDPTNFVTPNNGGLNMTDEYLSQTEMMKPYANSWLLTSVVSNDYVDLTGNGPSPDDLGFWVKFNYKKTSNNYNWRLPYQYANYIEGCKNDPKDDKGILSFGQKELYYIESIETKTHVAIFYTSPRQDGVGANDMLNGGCSSSPDPGNVMYKLDSVKLYTQASYASANPVPIKTVHFRYSYELCPNVPNNTGNPVDFKGHSPALSGNTNVNAAHGKLTLDTMFFTYQYSYRGEASPYVFHYNAAPLIWSFPPPPNGNVGYSDTYVDRWGNYKNNLQYSGTSYPYWDFPYTDQYENTHPQSPTGNNLYAYEWTLDGIDLPTGGTINIKYELKDYAYVENNRAQAMFDIAGFNDTPTSLTDLSDASDRTAQTAPASTEADNNNGNDYRVWFKLESPQISWNSAGASAASDSVYKYYLGNGNITNVYFKVYCDFLKNGGNIGTNSTADYVSGYANLAPGSAACGLDASGGYGYVTLQSVPIGSVNIWGLYINPITLACVEYLQKDRPELIYS